VSHLILDIAYIATVASTVVGLSILVGGTVFLVEMVRAFTGAVPETAVDPEAPADVFDSIYLAILAREADAERGELSVRATPHDSLPVFALVAKKREGSGAPPPSSEPQPQPENICA
jgi:hypothetical protein